jgi:hypothetical protein
LKVDQSKLDQADNFRQKVIYVLCIEIETNFPTSAVTTLLEIVEATLFFEFVVTCLEIYKISACYRFEDVWGENVEQTFFCGSFTA